ncbi:Cu-oxidase 4 family protein [Pseudogulbenkiania sp. NH8B]|uniref:peptidoglycan editing factor PgeF n=1 Tax=Pseudogulbenkiania sp. (strain NH8B) TaxID=748280 RepID=UPI0002279FD1|nr:peptidoglycan editing factor PgeF [Pseudogulbenkiania sp. NH8B]BAK76736.1 Cu-oxidase 4 family protein [Pseudogulbenkiania sp. NH8B]
MFATNPDWLTADWPAPAKVKTLVTTRKGGVSEAPYDSFNLGAHVGDLPEHVSLNRETLRRFVPEEPAWLNQVHGTRVVNAADVTETPPEADASVSRTPDAVCVIMTADCLPVLLTSRDGSVVGAAHAGWRGLCDGVIEATVSAMNEPAANLMAWLGPAIGPDAFEVGAEVRAAFMAHDPAAAQAFTDIGEGKFLADIYTLARQRLAALGISDVYGGDFCTVIDRERFFSYRRDRTTGRMASLIWIEP